MHITARLFAVLALIGASMIHAVPASAEARPTATPGFAQLLKPVLPGVVSIAVRGHITAEPNPLFQDPEFRRCFNIPDNAKPPEQDFQAVGSGVIVDAAKGYILTNNHVIENADEITVVLGDRRQLTAKKVGSDSATDVAVIQVTATGLTAVPMGDSSSLQIGDYVVAIGNPFGLGQTATMGIVSALGRTGLGIEGYEDFIQTDASINPGNSGGALIDLDGRLVGINSAIIGPSGGSVGIGFAIPINLVASEMDDLIAHGSIEHAQLGVTVADMPGTSGAVVQAVLPRSPAEGAGIKVGDVIVAIDGQAVVDGAALRTRIGLLRAGDSATITLSSGGTQRDVKVVLQQVPAPH